MNITQKKNQQWDNFPLHFNNVLLEPVVNHKHLGLNLNVKLKWADHIDNIIESVSKMLHVLQKLKYSLDRKTLETIYLTFVRPKLEYACIIWDDCSIDDKERLESMQLNFARVVTGAKRGTSHELLYKEISWQPLSERRSNSKMKFMHKIVNKTGPDYLNNLIPEKVGDCSNYGLRDKGNFKQIKTRTEKYRKSIIPDCVRQWNKLEDCIKSNTDYLSFVNLLKVKLQPNPLFYGVKRKLAIIHSQFRLKCSNLNSHLHKLHVVPNPFCMCDNQTIEDCYHFFFKCNLYATQRISFLQNVRLLCDKPINVLIDVLLYGDNSLSIETNVKLFSLVENFIFETERFDITL